MTYAGLGAKYRQKEEALADHLQYQVYQERVEG